MSKYKNALLFFACAGLIGFSGPLGLWSLKHLFPLLPVFGLAGLVFLLIKILRPGALSDPIGESATSSGKPWRSGRSLYLSVGVTGSALAFLFFYHFRLRVFLPPPEGLGDSLLLLDTLPVYSQIFGYLDSFEELITLFIYSRLYLSLSGNYGMSAQETYAIFNSLVGVAYLVLIFFFLRERSGIEKKYGVLLLVLSPALQLYAGYMENYALPSLYLTALLVYQSRALEQAKPGNGPGVFILSGLFAAWMVLHHIATGAILPALACFVWLKSSGRSDFVKNAVLAAIPAVLLLGVSWYYFFVVIDNPVSLAHSHISAPPIYPPGRILLPQHFWDMLNQILIGAPLALLILTYHIFQTSTRGPKNKKANLKSRIINFIQDRAPTPVLQYLLIATLCMLATTFLTHPQLGFPADWDIFSFFQAPLNLYAFYLLAGQENEPDKRSESLSASLPHIAALLLLAFVLSFGWILRNANYPTPFSFLSNTAIEKQSQENLNVSREIVETTTDKIRRDPLFEKITRVERRRLFVKEELFSLRSRKKLAAFPDTKARDTIILNLEKARTRFRSYILYPEERYRREYGEIWEEFTRVNIGIQKLTNDERTMNER